MTTNEMTVADQMTVAEGAGVRPQPAPPQARRSGSPAIPPGSPAIRVLSFLLFFLLIGLALAAGPVPPALAQSPPPTGAPASLAAQAAGTAITLTWPAVPGAVTYNLYRAAGSTNVGSTPFRTGLPASPLAFTDAALIPGNTYYYRLTAVGQSGESAQSTLAFTSILAVPATLATHSGDTQVTVSWTPVSGASGYNVYRGTSPGGEAATSVASLSGAYTDFTDAGLTNSQPYYYQVTAATSLSESARSAEVSGTPTPPPPLAPAGLTLSPGGGQIGLSWTASSGATGYNVYRATAAGQEAAPALVSQTGTSYTDPSLTNGATYYYVVTAVNADGESAFSPERTAVPNGAPAVPTGLTAVPGGGQVSLAWATVSGSVTYNVRRAASASGPWGSPVGVSGSGGSSTGYVDTGLTNGTAYYYTVTSVNHLYSTMESAPCAPVSAMPGAAPSAPTGLTATATGLTASSGQVALAWAAVSGATGYDVYRSTPSYGQELPVPVASGLSAPSYTDTALGAGQSYYYKVTAVGGGSESVRSAEAGAAVLAAPAALTAQSGNTQVSLSWGLVAGAGSYNLYRGTSAGGEGATAYKTGLTRGAYEDTGLTNGTTYYYQVTAAASHSEGARSPEAQGLPSSPPPLSPPGLSLAPGNAQVALSWTASSGATGYSVYRGTSSGGEGASPLKAGATGLTWTDAGAVNGTTYYYQVTAANGSAESARSGELSATPLAPPAAPSYLSATAKGTGQVQLYWGASPSATSYLLERSPDGSTGWSQAASGNVTGYLDTELSAGTGYWYRVSGSDVGGFGPYATAATSTLLSAPAGLAASAGNNQVTLSWPAVAGASSYTLYRGTSAGGESYPALASVSGAMTSYMDTAAVNGTAYYYTLKAVDGGGRERSLG